MSRRRRKQQRGPSLSAVLILAIAALAIFGTAGFLLIRGSEPESLASSHETTGEYVPLGPLAVSGQQADLGRVPLDTNVTHVFRLRNTSEEPVRLGRVTVGVLEGC